MGTQQSRVGDIDEEGGRWKVGTEYLRAPGMLQANSCPSRHSRREGIQGVTGEKDGLDLEDWVGIRFKEHTFVAVGFGSKHFTGRGIKSAGVCAEEPPYISGKT